MFAGVLDAYQTWPYMKNHYHDITISGFDAKLNSVIDARFAFQSRWFSDAESLSAVNYVGEYNNISTDYVSGTGFHNSIWSKPDNFLGYIGVASNGNLVVDFLTQGKWTVISNGNAEDGIHNTPGSPFNTYLIEKYNQNNEIIGAYLQTEADLSDLMVGGNSTLYDVTGKYIPDASKWNEEVYQPNKSKLKIVEVLGGVAGDVKTKI